MLDIEQVKKLFLLYNYKIERLEKEYLVFSYSNPYDAVEVVPILGLEKQEIERIQSEFQEAGYAVKINNCKNIEEIPQFRNIIPCEVLFYIEVTFWALSIDLGIFRSSWFLHRHKIPHPNQWGSMITTKKYSLFYEDFSVVGFICI